MIGTTAKNHEVSQFRRCFGKFHSYWNALEQQFLTACKRQVQKPKQERESLCFVYKIAHLHNLGRKGGTTSLTLTETPFALHGVCTANLLCLPQPQRKPSSLQLCHTHRVLHTQHTGAPGSGTRPSSANTPSKQDVVGQPQLQDCCAPRGQNSKHRLCQPSVPKGIKQACQIKSKRGKNEAAKIKKGLKNQKIQ